MPSTVDPSCATPYVFWTMVAPTFPELSDVAEMHVTVLEKYQELLGYYKSIFSSMTKTPEIYEEENEKWVYGSVARSKDNQRAPIEIEEGTPQEAQEDWKMTPIVSHSCLPAGSEDLMYIDEPSQPVVVYSHALRSVGHSSYSRHFLAITR